jgi:hypothetical protein
LEDALAGKIFDHCLKFQVLTAAAFIKVCHLYEKLKKSRNTNLEGKGASMYSSCSFIMSTPDGGEWSLSRPSCALPPGKVPRYPLDRKLVGTQNVGVGLGRLVTGLVGSNTARGMYVCLCVSVLCCTLLVGARDMNRSLVQRSPTAWLNKIK